ncbi:MAG: hypothetical protein ACLRVU_01315 [Beduini sp.]|uniref:hypothetical protein n=1 Tax=Beduini sp. TaxID=1922300 RepID=UPI00399F7B3B
MTTKGSNLIIQEHKQNILSAFNHALQDVPVYVLELIANDLLHDITVAKEQAIQKEQQEYQEAMQKEFDANQDPE